MPQNASTKGAFLNVASGNRNSGGNRSYYQDKDKPAQIRFSNISARELISDGGAPEIDLALHLNEYSHGLSDMESFCIPAYGKALEIIPFTLAENAGLNLIDTETDMHKERKLLALMSERGGIQPVLTDSGKPVAEILSSSENRQIGWPRPCCLPADHLLLP